MKQEDLQREIKALNKSLAEDSLSEYIRQAWHVVEPSTEYLHNWHIDLICEYLELITAAVVGKLDLTDEQYENLLRTIFNIPPRYMKSLCITVMWPTWTWIKYPWTRWLFSSYSSDLSKKHSVDRRDIIQSAWYQGNWGHLYQISEDQNEKMAYKNTKGGHMISTSTGGSATGQGGDFVVEDDPHNPKQAESDTQRQTAIDFHKGTLSTRLNNKKRGARVVVMQRLHEQDVTGYELARGGWWHINIRAVAEGKETYLFPLSGKVHAREDGDLLWPEREGQKEIDQAREALGSYGFAGQYQQSPSPAGGGILKAHWWRFWQYPGQNLPPVMAHKEVQRQDGTVYTEMHACPVIDLPVVIEQEIQSWDMAFKDSKKSDYVVGQHWARLRANKFFMDQVRDKLDFVKTVQAFESFTVKHPDAAAKLVEDKANGPAVISVLQSKIPGIIPVEPMGSKEARVRAVTPQIESGNVYLPHPINAPWVEGFILRCSQFPNGQYDDEQDAMSQALSHFPKGSAGPELIEVGPQMTSAGGW